MFLRLPLTVLLLASVLSPAFFINPSARASAPRLPVTPPSAAAGQIVVADVSVFYEPLAPYGRWFQHTRYGYCWIPNGIVAGWRPYTHGYWDYTDDGWVWIPGTVWGPAWVAWRRGPGYIGWAPLPFEARWEAGVGLVNFDYDRFIEPNWYCFVGERHFGDRYLDRVIEVPARNITIIRSTTYITNNYTVVNSRVVNRGIDRDEAQRAIGRSIEVHHIRETAQTGATSVKGSDLMIYRPGAQGKGPRIPPGLAETSGGVKVNQAKLDKQHQKEQQALADQQVKEKATLEKQHDQELKLAQKQQRKAQQGATTTTTAQVATKQERKAQNRASGGQIVEDVKTRQDTEHQAHDQRWTKEKNAMTGRHDAENTGRIPAPSFTSAKPPKSSGSSTPPNNPKPRKGKQH